MNSYEDGGIIGLRGKLLLLGIVVISVFLVFTIYLFNLQIVENLFWERRAKEVSSRFEPLPAQRGLIWDRNLDKPLALNIDSFAIHIVPAEIPPYDPREVAHSLSSVLEIETEEILRKIPSNWTTFWNRIEIKGGVPYEKVVRIAENNEKYPGVHWSSKPYRWYNSVGSISHLLGYVGNITVEELQILYNEGYGNTSNLGKRGIEKSHDTLLRGHDGRISRIFDAQGRNLGEVEEVEPPINGFDVVLTIDRHIQKLAEKALGQRKGSLIVLKPSNGEILAMASYPSFDPNRFADEGPVNFESLSLNTDSPFLNRSIQSSYVPASTFKIIMTAAILGEKAVDPRMKVNCEGTMVLGNRQFTCHKKSGHGPLNLRQALEQSCNIYFGTVGVKYIGIDAISRYAREFGLGSLTDIELDGEIGGIVPDKKWKEEKFNSPWTGGDTLNTSIGQGFINATPLQMANVMAAIVNKGTIYRPHLVSEIRKPGSGFAPGLIHKEIKPEVIKSIDLLKEQDYLFLQNALRGVVTGGTVNPVIMTDSVTIAGKTGTGEIGYDDRWHNWFVAYGPHQSDKLGEQVVLVAMVEASEPPFDWWAPKAADIVFEGIFSNRSYEEVIAEWKRRDVWWSRHLSDNSIEVQ